jgi:hypothetical protein
MSHSWDLLAELKEATSHGCRCMRLCQFIQQRTFLIVFLKMDSVLVALFREHYDHEAWWCKIKIKPKIPSNSTHDAMLPPDEAPGEFPFITPRNYDEGALECPLPVQLGPQKGSA